MEISFDTTLKDIDRFQSEGKTIMILTVNGKATGIAAAADLVKPTAAKAVARMQ